MYNKNFIITFGLLAMLSLTPQAYASEYIQNYMNESNEQPHSPMPKPTFSSLAFNMRSPSPSNSSSSCATPSSLFCTTPCLANRQSPLSSNSGIQSPIRATTPETYWDFKNKRDKALALHHKDEKPDTSDISNNRPNTPHNAQGAIEFLFSVKPTANNDNVVADQSWATFNALQTMYNRDTNNLFTTHKKIKEAKGIFKTAIEDIHNLHTFKCAASTWIDNKFGETSETTTGNWEPADNHLATELTLYILPYGIEQNEWLKLAARFKRFPTKVKTFEAHPEHHDSMANLLTTALVLKDAKKITCKCTITH